MTMPAALFISDLHLQRSHPRTSAAFLCFLEHHAQHAQALYLLGDLFEYWAGDDDLEDPFNARMTAALRAVSDAGVHVCWIAGNRDFLVGAGFAFAAGATLLNEPHVTTIAGQRIVLLHGDAECTKDAAYMEFRAMVRQPAWQRQFLAMPLTQRKAIIDGLRQNSREHNGVKSMEIMDVTPEAVAQVFAEQASTIMIHGHTHRPALHEVDGTLRYVLPDWECDVEHAELARGGWIAIDGHGVITRHALDGAIIE